MKGKEFLKRVFFGKLIPLPSEITEGMADYTPPVPISNEVPDSEYKVMTQGLGVASTLFTRVNRPQWPG
jgi:hypothetical protein